MKRISNVLEELFSAKKSRGKVFDATSFSTYNFVMSLNSFVKYSGNGNDFILMSDQIELSAEKIRHLCHRHFGIGADGLITLGPSDKADGRMRIYNADGSEAEMCGNGLRCLATYLDELSSPKKDSYLVETMNAIYPVFRKGKSFALEMSEIKDKNIYDLTHFKDYTQSFYINTGVPHLVFLTQDVDKIDLKKVGAYYRYHSLFPKGTNVTFVEVREVDGKKAFARTYERGVEDETFSCGTGLTATALALSHWLNWSGDIHLRTKGGEQLVTIGEKIFYSGEVTKCFQGEIEL
jgi:diaminopimelate epimerase